MKVEGRARRVLGAFVTIAVLFGAVACSSDKKGARDQTRKDATVNGAADFDARQRAYLEAATQSLAPGAALSVLAHFERAARDPQFKFDPATVTPEAFAPTFKAIDNFDDTTDFDVLYLINLWYAYGDKLPPATRDAMAKRFEAFKYWYTEPTPKGIVDNKYYWSENHRIIYYVDEYLAGLAFKDATFTNDGRTGAAHADTAKRRILQWLDEKVRFGFTEWHSDVYYQKDVTPLLTLVEFAPDPDLANRAAMVLDLFLLDIAVHLQKGNFGATHGRSYMKDKSIATDQDTFTFSKLLFDDTTLPYPSGADPGGTLFARATKYAVPPVIRAIARDDTPIVDQEHMNVPLDATAPVVSDPASPFGISFDDPENVPFWWERGAQTAWQTVPLTIHALDTYKLWDSKFYKSFKPLRDAVGNDMVSARMLAQQLAPVLAFGLLSEVHSYAYRARDVMLSTAQDYRPGVFAEQEHAWQATLDEKAIVFTTHPKNEPQHGTEWPDDDGYWTGTGSIPRSAQYRTVGIHIYNPQFEPMGPPFDAFSYLDYTHAYFPQEYFDEVHRSGNWTFGRKGDGYVALWSARPPEWRTHDPAKVFTHGLTKPFDLVARGGPDNVWIVEVGDAAKWKTFDAFRRAITDAPVKVAAGAEHAVDYTSPTEGRMTFGFTKPFTVAGKDINLHPALRFDNPYVHVPFEGRQYDVKAGNASLLLDFDAWTRKVGSG